MTYRDTGVQGLGLKVEPSGQRAFYWSLKVNGRTAWKTIGLFEDTSIEEARAKATEYNSLLAKWKRDGCPGDGPFERSSSPTLGELVAAYAARHLPQHAARPEKAEADATKQMDRYGGRWRDRKMNEIRKEDIVGLHDEVQENHGAYSANRLIQLIRAAINWSAEASLWRGENPARGIKLFRETKRRRFLLAPELLSLKNALEDKETTADLRHYVLLALLTGARKGDILSMRWENVDLGRATWLVPQPKNKEPYYVPLTAEAVRILEERKALAEQLQEKTRKVSPFVFPSHGASGRIMDLKKAWAELLQRAKISNLRQHDMRRTLGRWQAAGGASLTVIGKSLGHKSLGSTQIYAQLSLDPVRASVEAATRAMFATEESKESAEKRPKRLLAAPQRKAAWRG